MKYFIFGLALLSSVFVLSGVFAQETITEVDIEAPAVVSSHPLVIYPRAKKETLLVDSGRYLIQGYGFSIVSTGYSVNPDLVGCIDLSDSSTVCGSYRISQ